MLHVIVYGRAKPAVDPSQSLHRFDRKTVKHEKRHVEWQT